MKKLLIICLLSLNGVVLANETKVEKKEVLQIDCNRIATIMCEVYEAEFECCMDSDDFNSYYFYWYNKCNKI
jgi:hypothetical protein